VRVEIDRYRDGYRYVDMWMERWRDERMRGKEEYEDRWVDKEGKGSRFRLLKSGGPTLAQTTPRVAFSQP
jgi:hypothetical protein